MNGLGAYNQFSVMLKSCGGGYFDEEGNLNIADNKKFRRFVRSILRCWTKEYFRKKSVGTPISAISITVM